MAAVVASARRAPNTITAMRTEPFLWFTGHVYLEDGSMGEFPILREGWKLKLILPIYVSQSGLCAIERRQD